MPLDIAVRPRDDTADIVASFRQLLAGIDGLPRPPAPGWAGDADLGFPGTDIRLFTHRGVRCRLYQRHAVEPYVGTPVDPTGTVSLTLADDRDQREYTYVVGGGDTDKDLRIRRRVSRPGHWRSAWRQLNDAEVRALVEIASGHRGSTGDIGDEELTRLLTLVTDLSARERDLLYVPCRTPPPAIPTLPTTPAILDRWHRGAAVAAGALVVVLLAAVVTQSARSSPQARIRILQAYVSTPAPAPAKASPTRATRARSGSPRRATRGPLTSPPPRRAATSTATATATATPRSTWVPAVPGAHWPCDAGPAITVDVDPTGVTGQELAYEITAIQQAANDTGRQIVITKAPFSPSVVQAGNTIYVAWHGIDKVPATTDLHPAWTALYVNYPPLADGSTTPEIWSADTVFRAGLPQIAYYHETGRDFGLGDSPYPTDDGFGGNFQAARVPPHQDFSTGDIAGLRAGGPPC